MLSSNQINAEPKVLAVPRNPTSPSKHSRERMPVQKRRIQILETATVLIAERGFWGVTLRDVAIICGITEAGVLHHFASKAKLLIAVLEYRDEADFHALAKLLGIDRSDIDRSPLSVSLRQLCTALITRNAGQPEIVRLYSVLNAEALEPSHPAHDYFQDREKMALSLFRRAMPDTAEAVHISRQILAAMDGLQLRWLRMPNEVDLVPEWENLFERAFL